jgi:hypothetical protein
MDVQLRVIRSTDFLTSSHAGELDLERSKQILMALAAANKPPNDRDVLVDLRAACGDRIEMSKVIELVKVMIENLASFQNKLALLIPKEHPGERSRLMKQQANARGFNMDVFDDYEEAMTWLMSSAPVAPPRIPRI